ncbi:resolvase, N-terminal domain protein [Bacillus sp. OxB-1]|uniref:sigma-70 family RNA polymerase sigma factor n=1 Tax=Bacillus sp. (strain OxB-1) TaxID=98228 RepID=UPI000581F95E|nr:sigma-70 family RNA polymerase sigma factor [Bacillus sp. OxB-1]BAQ11326.1 resolvase, N-terminal domain protein [Bacillus sp. OxB-1]
MYSTKEIVRLYHEEKMSGPQIAKMLGCSTSLVYYRLNSDPRPMRTREEAGWLQTIKSFYGFIPSRFKD